MDMRDGALGVVIIAVALVAALFASYLAGAETETREYVDYEYLTDVNGLFDWDRTAQYIEYDPSTNYTGYYSTESDGYFPTDLVGFKQYNDPETGNQGKINNYNLDIEPIASETQNTRLDWGRGSNYYTVYYHTSAYDYDTGQNHLWYTVEPMVESIADLAERLEVPQGLKAVFMSPDGQQPNITGPVAIYADNLTSGYDWMLFTMFTDRNNPGEWRYWDPGAGYDYYDGILRLDIYNQELSTGSNLVACLSCVYDPIQKKVTRYYDNNLTQLCDVIDADSCLVVYGGSTHGDDKLVLTSSIDWYTLVPQDKVYLDPTLGVWLKDHPDSASFQLAYNARNGSNAPEAQVYIANEYVATHTFIVSDQVPNWAGFEFLGWSTSPYSERGQYHAGDTIQVYADRTVTLYAIWEKIGTNGTADHPLTEFTGKDLSRIQAGTDVYVTGHAVISIAGYERSHGGDVEYGLSATGLSGDDIGLSIIGEESPYGIAGTVTQPGTAVVTVTRTVAVGDNDYETDEYTFRIIALGSFALTYDANGGRDAPSTQVYNGTEENHSFTISDDRPVRPGYAFKGWALTSNALEAEVWNSIVVRANTVTVLYAVWSADGVYGTEENPLEYWNTTLMGVEDGADIYVSVGGYISLSGFNSYTAYIDVTAIDDPSGVGVIRTYSFPHGVQGTIDNPGTATITVEFYTGDGHGEGETSTMVFRIHGVNTFTLNFYGNGGQDAPDQLVHSSTTETSHAFTIPADEPNRDGYEFAGWGVNQADTVATYQPGDTVTIGVGLTILYAVWSVPAEPMEE